jgi:2-dehydro-3-deoxygluconokinase
VAWVGRTGDDDQGRRVLRELRAEQVEVLGPVDPDRPTGLMIKSRPTVATTRVRYYRKGSAGSALEAADVPAGLIEDARILHVTGITPLLSESARETVLAAVDRARAAGVVVSFDVNYRSALARREVAGPILAEIASQADVVFGGTEELALLLGEDKVGEDVPEHQLLHRVRALGPGEVVDKRGADGARALAGGTVLAGTRDGADAGSAADLFHAPARGVAAVDTVGAGDAFVAGYLSALLGGLDVPARLERGNACGAIACTAPGDWEAAPRREDLETFGTEGVDPVSR